MTEFTSMTIDPIPPHTLLSFDIRPVLATLDMYPIKAFALSRYQAENNINPDHALLYTLASPMAQKLQAIQEQVIDDFIISSINGFEHTWIQRDLRHVTHKELLFFSEQTQARHELYLCARFKSEFAGMFAHYQRIGNTIFLAIPKYHGGCND